MAKEETLADKSNEKLLDMWIEARRNMPDGYEQSNPFHYLRKVEMEKLKQEILRRMGG